MKKVLVLLFIGLCITLSAFAGGSRASGSAVNLVWLHQPFGYMGPYSSTIEWRETMIRQFTRDNPNVNISFEETTWNGWQAALATGIAANTPPDIFAFGSWIANDYKDYLEPIDSYLGAERDDFIESALEAGTFDGKAYAWPWFHSGTNIVVNMDLARERGVRLPTNPEGDWTLAEFLEACRLFTHDDVYAFPLYAVSTSINWQMVSIIANFGGDLFSADRRWANVNTPESLAALEFMLRMQDEYRYSPPGGVGLDSAAAGEMFLQGRLAMNVNGGDFSASLRQAVEQGRAPKMFDIEYVQFPIVPGRNTTATRIGPTGFVVFKQHTNVEARRDAAMAFCKMLTSAEELRYMTEHGIFVPVRKSLAPLFPLYRNFVAAERGKVIYDAHVPETVYNEDIMVLFQSVLGRTRTPAQALAHFDTTVNAKIQRFYNEQ